MEWTLPRRRFLWKNEAPISPFILYVPIVLIRAIFHEKEAIRSQEKGNCDNTRGYQKVRRLMRYNQYLLSYAYKFCRGYKTTNVLTVVKI